MSAKRCVWIAVLVCTMAVTAGCRAYDPAAEGGDPGGFSVVGTGHEMGRGVVNVAFSWLEIPYQVESHVRKVSWSSPFGVIAAVFETTFGVIDGAFTTVGRATGGLFEILMSPFPPYDPMMDPPFPPYLNASPEEVEE